MDSERLKVSLWNILWEYFLVGLTAFSMAILQKLKSLVMKNKWMSEEEMNEGLALVQLYPGPIMVDFTAYVGYKLRGVPGAVMATSGFILPSFFMILALSALYFAAASLSWIHILFAGLEALVIGVIFNVTIDLGARALKGKVEAVLALVAFAALLFRLDAIWIVLSALIFGGLLIRPASNKSVLPRAETSTPLTRWLGITFVSIVIIGVALFSLFLRSDVGSLALSLFKIGSVAFGNGTTIIPLIQSDVVDGHHWLTMSQFVDGIALGQITPGPFLITAAFIGYKMGGVFGAALATFAMFSPSFAMTLIFSEIFMRIRDFRVVRGALAGVLASFVGMLAFVILQLSEATLRIPAAFVFAALAFVAVRWFDWDVLAVFGGGLSIWLILMSVHMV
ncbi:MAG TPA: chromate efflux transporter [Candidatus Kryptobacter bacterium]|nr:chromate efflux transporter [Candidatus Kryptobacter bacterium]